MSFISYATQLEDVMLWRLFSNIDKGFFVDVGVDNPQQDSVTRAFYERGWRGVNIAEDVANVELLLEFRSDDINFRGCFQVKNLATNYAPLLSLDVILASYANESIRFLRIADESAEGSLRQIDFNLCRPQVILIKHSVCGDLKSFLVDDLFFTESGYQPVWFDGATRFYLANEFSEKRAFFSCPPHDGDNFIRYSDVVQQNTIQKLQESLEYERHIIKEINQESSSHNISSLLNSLNILQQQYAFNLEQQRCYFDEEKKALQVGISAQHVKISAQLALCIEQKQCIDAELQSVYSGQIWRATKPVRLAVDVLKPMVHKVREGGTAWLRLTPESRPRRIARRVKVRLVQILNIMALWVKRHPRLFARLQTELDKRPAIRLTLKRFVTSKSAVCVKPLNKSLGRSAEYIYQRLQNKNGGVGK